MNSIAWSYPTLLLYLCVSVLGVYGIKNAKVNHTKLIAGIISLNAGYALFFLAYWLLAILRSIDNGLGGVDIMNYLRIFENSINTPLSMESLIKSAEVEPLFLLLNKIIRSITTAPVIYMAVMYGIIVLGYIAFIKAWCPENNCFIPLIVLIFPFLKSFCTLRSSVAVAFFLFGLSIYKRNKVFGSIVSVLSVFVHISSVLYAPFLIFHNLYRSKLKQISKLRLICFFIIYLILAYISSVIFKNYFGASIITGNYSYYANTLRGNSFLQRIPLYFMQIVLGIVMVLENERINKDYTPNDSCNTIDNSFIRVCCIYDIVVIPVAYMFGIWRANEFFYLPRLLMWGSIIASFKRSTDNPKSKFLIDVIALGVSLMWLIFRLSREFAELGIMPYQLAF